MHKIYFWLLFLFPLGSLALSSSAISLNQLLQEATLNNYSLKAAQSNIEQAKGRLLQAGLWPNPNFIGMDIDDRFLTNEGEYTKSAGFMQAFPISGRIGHQKKVAQIDIDLARIEVNNAKRLLQAEIATRYYGLLITDYRLKQLDYLREINHKLVLVTQNRMKEAEVSELDANTAQLEHQKIQQEQQILINQRIDQVMSINQLLGRKPNSPLTLQKILPPLSPFPLSLTKALSLAFKQRPDLHLLKLNLQKAQAKRQLAHSERFADWNIGLAVQENKLVVQGTPKQKPDRALSLTVAVPLPLFNANQGKIKEAFALGEQVLTNVEALKLAIETEVSSNYQQIMNLSKALGESRFHSQTLTRKNIQLAKKAYHNGQLSLLEVLQLQRQYSDLTMAYLTMLEKYTQAFVNLCTALSSGNNQTFCSFLNKGDSV